MLNDISYIIIIFLKLINAIYTYKVLNSEKIIYLEISILIKIKYSNNISMGVRASNIVRWKSWKNYMHV